MSILTIQNLICTQLKTPHNEDSFEAEREAVRIEPKCCAYEYVCRSQRTTTSGQFTSQQPWCKINYRGKMSSAVTGDGPGRKSYFYIIVHSAYWPRNCFYIIVYGASVLAKKLLSLLSAGLTGQGTTVSIFYNAYCMAKELLSLLSTALTGQGTTVSIVYNANWPRNYCLYCLQR